MSLNKAAIFAACEKPPAVKEVFCPSYGGTVKVRALSGTEREAWEAMNANRVKGGKVVNHKNFRAGLVVLAAVDDDGNKLFDESDLDRLTAGPALDVDLMFAAASSLAGLSKEDEETMLKNSGAAPSGNSG